jgi:hypothetical protein
MNLELRVIDAHFLAERPNFSFRPEQHRMHHALESRSMNSLEHVIILGSGHRDAFRAAHLTDQFG